VAEVEVVSGPEPFKLVKAPVSLVLMLGAITALPPMAIDMYLPSLPASPGPSTRRPARPRRPSRPF
jgi:hypothetical protein